MLSFSQASTFCLWAAFWTGRSPERDTGNVRVDEQAKALWFVHVSVTAAIWKNTQAQLALNPGPFAVDTKGMSGACANCYLTLQQV